MPMLVLLRHTRQSGCVTGKLSQCYPTDITAALQLGHIFGYWIVEAELAALHGFRQRRRREHLANRAEIEDRIGVTRSFLASLAKP